MPTLSAVNTKQPRSIPNDRPAIWDLVVPDIKRRYADNLAAPVVEQLIADIKERDEMGFRKHSVRLQAFNGRDVLVDLYQETMDQICYAAQMMEETFDPLGLHKDGYWMAKAVYERGVQSAVEIRAQLTARKVR